MYHSWRFQSPYTNSIQPLTIKPNISSDKAYIYTHHWSLAAPSRPTCIIWLVHPTQSPQSIYLDTAVLCCSLLAHPPPQPPFVYVALCSSIMSPHGSPANDCFIGKNEAPFVAWLSAVRAPYCCTMHTNNNNKNNINCIERFCSANILAHRIGIRNGIGCTASIWVGMADHWLSRCHNISCHEIVNWSVRRVRTRWSQRVSVCLFGWIQYELSFSIWMVMKRQMSAALISDNDRSSSAEHINYKWWMVLHRAVDKQPIVDIRSNRDIFI